MTLIAETLRAAIENLALYCTLQIACKITFAKVRRSMLYPGSQSLNPDLVTLELRQVLEMGGETLELMNNEYVGVLNVTPTEVLNRRHWTQNNPWMPPAWRAPAFGFDSDAASAAVDNNTKGMENLRDRVIADWKNLHNGEDLSFPHLKMYMTGLAVQAVENSVPGYEEAQFDGDE